MARKFGLENLENEELLNNIDSTTFSDGGYIISYWPNSPDVTPVRISTEAPYGPKS